MSYITVQDLRIEGVEDPPYSDEHLVERITLAENLFNELTGLFFEPREGFSMKLSGRGYKILSLPIPPTAEDSITSVEIDGEVLDPEYYEVDISFPHGMDNPKLIRPGGIWTSGYRNIKVTGTFGYVDEDGNAPALVKQAVKAIAIWNIDKMSDISAQRESRIIEETLKDYTYKLSEARSGGSFGDPLIDKIIRRYRQTKMGAV